MKTLRETGISFQAVRPRRRAGAGRTALMLIAMATTAPTLAQPAAAPVAASAPAAAVFPMNDQVREKVRGMRQVALSPDGRQVLATITDTTAAGGQAHLWLLAPGAKPRQLTFGRTGETGESAGQWAPDGKSILFVARRDGTKTISRLPLSGGEPVPLQLFKAVDGGVTGQWGGEKLKGAALSIGGFAFSPDGEYLAIWADEPEDPAAKARKDKKDDGYSHGEEVDKTRLYLLDPESAAARPIPLGGKFSDLSWSYDSADMIVSTDPDSDEKGPDTTVWQVTPDGTATRLDLPNTAAGATFLPGRKRIVYTQQCVDDAPPRCDDLFVKDLAGGEARNLTRGFDGAIPSDFFVDAKGDLVMTIATHMRQRLARLSTRDGKVSWIDTGLPVVGSLSTNHSRSGWAMIGASSTQPATVLYSARLGGAPVPLATPALVPADWAPVPSKLVKWQNEGLEIEGLLYLPKVPQGTKVPLVVSVHGGPAGRFADGYSNQVQMLVAEGWAVFATNPRGSTGYGAKFLAANKNDLGGADYRDIMTGIDTVLRDYPLDADRMALIGYSYGGEMAGFVVGKTNRFKAIVSGAPVINQFSEYGTERGTYYDRWYYGKPWLNFEDAWRQSPLAYVDKAETPFLLLQGETDPTDPLGQSLEMWRALRQSDAPVALIVYPREDHGLLGQNFAAGVSTEPWHGVDVRRRYFGFLRAAFAGEPDPLAKAREDGPPR